MSGVPSSSRHLCSVLQRESKRATAGRASVVALSQHTNPNERSFGRTDQWATSKELGSLNSGRGNARCSLNYSSTASQAEDSERIISELRREIHDLRQEVRGRSPAKKRPRNKETYKNIDGCGEEVAVRTFKLGLPLGTGLHHSLTKRPAPTLGKLMHRIDQFIRVEEDGGGTMSVQTVAQPKDITPRPSARPRNAAKNLSSPSDFLAPSFRTFQIVFKEPIYKLMEKIKRKPFFVWPQKLLGNPALRDEKLYCTFHKDTGHITENCHMLKTHLEQLASAGHLDQYIDTNLTSKKEPSQTVWQPNSLGVASTGFEIQKVAHLRKSFSIIDSVHLAPICSVNGEAREQIISFSDSDLKDVQLPHNDPLVITLRIGNYDVQRDIPSTLHQKLRFPTKDGIMELNGDQEPEDGEVVMTEQPEKVLFDPSNPELFFLVGSKLSTIDKEQLLKLLMNNRDVFAWSVYDVSGVSPDLACHALNIGLEHKPIAQKCRKLALERATIVLEEVEHLLASGTIQEVQYPVWLSNTVVVKKKNGKWRVCIDFTDLNKACPKDPFSLPRIDQLVDSASGHARLSFLDAFQGYHQILMRTTYQKMVSKMFEHLIGKTVEVYIDDMLIKSLREEDHVANLLQVFDILRGSRLRLNASKCTFGVSSGKFLDPCASNSKGSGAGIVLVSPEGLVLEQTVRLKFSASNNEAEYEALMIDLKTARKLSASHLQAEVSNKVILSGIKRKLEAAKGKWVKELPSVLWTHKITVRKSTEFVVETNEDNLWKNLDLLEERRDLAVVHLASYQQRIRREHDKNIKPRVFRIGDLVLRKVMANTRKLNEGKLGPNWEGPFKVLSQAGFGAFRLEDMDGKPVLRPWNIYNLRKYFF
uniref:Uncharacterized protein n=1 Tax=Fagus sylvatica TaxID=28930 RepID=A0A2N9FPQ4_FAGSY